MYEKHANGLEIEAGIISFKKFKIRFTLILKADKEVTELITSNNAVPSREVVPH
jgi:hypothetical protein